MNMNACIEFLVVVLCLTMVSGQGGRRGRGPSWRWGNIQHGPRSQQHPPSRCGCPPPPWSVCRNYDFAVWVELEECTNRPGMMECTSLIKQRVKTSPQFESLLLTGGQGTERFQFRIPVNPLCPPDAQQSHYYMVTGTVPHSQAIGGFRAAPSYAEGNECNPLVEWEVMDNNIKAFLLRGGCNSVYDLKVWPQPSI